MVEQILNWFDQGYQRRSCVRKFGNRAYLHQMQPFSLIEDHETNIAALLEINLKVTRAHLLNQSIIQEADLPPGFDFGTKIFVWPYNRFGHSIRDEGVAHLFYSSRQQMLVLSFTGTCSLPYWLNNLRFWSTSLHKLDAKCASDMQVHSGFLDLYLLVRDYLWFYWHEFKDAVTELVLTGHSLGAAMATLAAYDFADRCPLLYAFASPRVGNQAFIDRLVSLVPQSYLIANIHDAIINLPRPNMILAAYAHLPTQILFARNYSTPQERHVHAYYDEFVQSKLKYVQ